MSLRFYWRNFFNNKLYAIFSNDLLTHFVELEFHQILTRYRINGGDSKYAIKKQ